MSYESRELVNKLMKLGDRVHLNREQAQTNLEKTILPGFIEQAKEDETVKQNSQQMIIDMLRIMFNSTRWEDRYGAATGATLLSKFYYVAEQKDAALMNFFWNEVRSQHIGRLLVDPEFRVRNQLGALLKQMILQDQAKGVQHFKALLEQLLKNVEDTFTREKNGGSDASANPLVLHNKKITAFEESDMKTMHDTEGWKSLETSMRIMQHIIEAIGDELFQFELDRILQVVAKGVDHINRFVREISYFLIRAVFLASATIYDHEKPVEKEEEPAEEEEDKEKDEKKIAEEAAIKKALEAERAKMMARKIENAKKFKTFCEQLVPIVSQGLGDNWSQVRYAATQAVRSFYQIIVDREDFRDLYDTMLVPKMCLNRYYVAEGVKIYSNETWRLIFKDQGKQIVCKYAEQICKFYISQSEADNHAVREAACHCISELCLKVAKPIDKEPFKPYVDGLLKALLDCFKDASWPVRDCACVACAHFVSAFPEESKAVFPELKQLWLEHLSDNIASVREHSSQSLIEVFREAEIYRADLKTSFEEFITENIMKIKDQKSESVAFKGISNETQFGVAKPVHDHEHTDGAMFSCGSLAPKLKRGGGCMDHGFTKPKEPWELTDGTVFLLRECSNVEELHPLVVSQLENLSNIGYIDSFKHSHSMREHLFKCLTAMVPSLGKKKFRASIELFLDPAFRVANTKDPNHMNMAYAGQDFLLQCEKSYGENIFKAIVEGHDDRYLSDLKRIKEDSAKFSSRNVDFVYPSSPRAGPAPGGFGGVQQQEMTKAPWAK